ncbi:hypothetical protein FBU30_006854 [Linnemannia zychae]|nr:hypothetical protein FBU30_006854 [Linnemannia zychae]
MEAQRGVQAKNKDEALSCRPDKAIKNKVDINSDQSMLVQLAAAYRKHAELLRNKGSPHRKHGTKSIVKAGSVFVAMVPEARMSLSSAHSNTLTTSLSTYITPHATQSPVPLSSSVNETTPVSRSVKYFDKDIYSFAFDMLSFPSPNCHLQDTHQLAACLTLLCTTELPEDELTLEVREWILATRSNIVELERLKKIAKDVTYAFIKADPKDSGVIAEVIPLAYNIDRDLYRHLLISLVDIINHSTLLNIDSLDGMAHVVQIADPSYINSDDLGRILQVLNNQLQKVHSEAVNYRYRLMFAISRVLDAMVAANVGDIDRINLYDPLTCLLDVSKSDTDLYLSFQVEFAAQALLNVSNDEKPWHAGFRRLWLALSVGASFAKVPDPTEIKMMLEGLEKLYNEGKRDFIALKEAINNKGRIEFTFKDGLQFKSIWYRALRTAELCIQTGRLSYFEEFVINAQCRDDRMFQMGVCQLLGQFVSNTRWDLEA